MEDAATGFAADPRQYLVPDAQPAAPAPAGAFYVCPMHPEVRRFQPGTCPNCGMALEPEMAQLGVPVEALASQAEALRAEGASMAK